MLRGREKKKEEEVLKMIRKKGGRGTEAEGGKEVLKMGE